MQGNIPRGKVLGGSSVLNYMQYVSSALFQCFLQFTEICFAVKRYVRGHPHDYDSWQLPGWSHTDLFPYFLKSENAVCCPNDPNHGHDGPLTISRVQPGTVIPEHFLQACEADGLPRVDPSLGIEGAGVTLYTMQHGRRWSTAQAFLTPVMNRNNLHVATSALVQRVLFENGADDVPRAVGVELKRHDVIQKVRLSCSWNFGF